MSLRYGYVSNGLTEHRLDDALCLLSDSGYDGIALTLDHIHFDPYSRALGLRAAELRNTLDELGLTCVIETGGRFVLHRRRKHYPSLISKERGRRIDLLRRAVDIAVQLHAPVVSLWSGAKPEDVEQEAAWQRLLESLELVVAHAEERGTMLGFEPEPGMLVETLADFERLRRELGRPSALGLTLDLGHCVCLEDEPVESSIRRLADQLVHVHADDMRRGVHEHLMFGEGELDVAAAMRALAEIEFEGMVAVELSRSSHRAHETVPASISVMRAAEKAKPAEPAQPQPVRVMS